MRHFASGAAKRAAATADIPIINAGDGPGQHPTQVCLTFLFCDMRYSLFKSLGLDFFFGEYEVQRYDGWK